MCNQCTKSVSHSRHVLLSWELPLPFCLCGGNRPQPCWPPSPAQPRGSQDSSRGCAQLVPSQVWGSPRPPPGTIPHLPAGTGLPGSTEGQVSLQSQCLIHGPDDYPLESTLSLCAEMLQKQQIQPWSQKMKCYSACECKLLS